MTSPEKQMPKPVKAVVARCFALAGCVLLAGCAMGALPTTNGDEASLNEGGAVSVSMDDGEFHSTTCDGLAVERRERLSRIEKLEQAIKTELAAPAVTIVQAVKRMGSDPEKGTTSYDAATAERAKLKVNENAAEKLSCLAVAVPSAVVVPPAVVASKGP